MYAIIPHVKSVTHITPDEIHLQLYGDTPNFRRHRVTHIFLTTDGLSSEFTGLFIFDRRMLQIMDTRNDDQLPHLGALPSVIIKYGTVQRVNFVPPQLSRGSSRLRYVALMDFRLILVGKNLIDISRELDSANNLQMIGGVRTGIMEA
jgi:hypothetical protein